MPNDPGPRRRSLRLPAYDCSQAGAYLQRGYYERVIRNEKALDRIRDYIANNPARWADDPDNLLRPAYAERGRV